MRDVLDIGVMSVHISGGPIDSKYEKIDVGRHHIVVSSYNCGVSWI